MTGPPGHANERQRRHRRVYGVTAGLIVALVGLAIAMPTFLKRHDAGADNHTVLTGGNNAVTDSSSFPFYIDASRANAQASWSDKNVMAYLPVQHPVTFGDFKVEALSNLSLTATGVQMSFAKRPGEQQGAFAAGNYGAPRTSVSYSDGDLVITLKNTTLLMAQGKSGTMHSPYVDGVSTEENGSNVTIRLHLSTQAKYYNGSIGHQSTPTLTFRFAKTNPAPWANPFNGFPENSTQATTHRVSDSFTPLGVSFADSKNGFIYGDTSSNTEVVGVTRDGGGTWSQTLTVEGNIGGLWTTDGTHVWVTVTSSRGQSLLYESSDGGKTWVSHRADVQLMGIQFTDSKRGWAEVANTNGVVSQLAKTEDGGQTWVASTIPQFNGQIIGFAFDDVHHGWLLVAHNSSGYEAKTLYITQDNGLSWSKRLQTSLKTKGSGLSANDTMTGGLASVVQNTALVWGLSQAGGQLYKVSSTGKWSTLSSVSGTDVMRGPVSVISSQNFYELATNSTNSTAMLFETTNGGKEWMPVHSWTTISGTEPAGWWYGR